MQCNLRGLVVAVAYDVVIYLEGTNPDENLEHTVHISTLGKYLAQVSTYLMYFGPTRKLREPTNLGSSYLKYRPLIP